MEERHVAEFGTGLTAGNITERPPSESSLPDLAPGVLAPRPTQEPHRQLHDISSTSSTGTRTFQKQLDHKRDSFVEESRPVIVNLSILMAGLVDESGHAHLCFRQCRLMSPHCPKKPNFAEKALLLSCVPRLFDTPIGT